MSRVQLIFAMLLTNAEEVVNKRYLLGIAESTALIFRTRKLKRPVCLRHSENVVTALSVAPQYYASLNLCAAKRYTHR